MAISFSSQKINDLRTWFMQCPNGVIFAPASPVPITPASYVEFVDDNGKVKRIFVEANDDSLLMGRVMVDAVGLGISSDPKELLQTAEFLPVNPASVTKMITVAHPP